MSDSRVVEVDVVGVLADLRRDIKTGHASRTVAKHGRLRLLLIALKPDASIAEHKADGRVSIHALSGHVRVNADGRSFDLPAGRLITLEPGERHDLQALEESAVLVTIALSHQPD